jgi:hypothetical protein
MSALRKRFATNGSHDRGTSGSVVGPVVVPAVDDRPVRARTGVRVRRAGGDVLYGPALRRPVAIEDEVGADAPVGPSG